MLRSTWLPILYTGLLSACITSSQSLGAGESGSSGGDDTASTSGGDPVCAPTADFDCTLPYDGGFGPCGGLDFDESCCMRPTCAGPEECAADEACVPVGNNGLSCHDENGACACSANPGGFPRSVCLPIDQLPVHWCAGYDVGQCDDAAHVFVGEQEQFCQVVDVNLLSIDGASCLVSEAEPRCLTIRLGVEQGCGPEPCAIGPDHLVLHSPVARFIDPDDIEVFGVDDVFCGSGHPVGDWVRGDDPSLGACAMTCGFDNPCALPFEEWVALRADASEDAPVDDCGDVDLEDPLADWQAAHDCALQHAMAGQGFRVIAQGQGIDSIVRVAWVGLQAESYAVVGIHSDQGAGAYALWEEVGAGLDDVAACTVTVGELCLATLAPGPTEQLCPP